jgi:hypothetical protein
MGFIFVLLCVANFAGGLQCHARECSSRELAAATESRQKQARDLEQGVTTGPFYQELQRKFGNPKTCRLKMDEDSITLSYAFRNHARLQARVSSAIEYAEQRADLRGLSSDKALQLLKAAEEESFGHHGCGMDWNKPESDATEDSPGSHAIVFRGDSCNCQARVLYQGTSVIGMVLSHSC